MNDTRIRVAAVGLLALVGAACGSGTSGGGNASVAAPAGLVSAGKLTFGSDISYPPQEFKDPNNATVGFDVDLGNAIAAKMGLTGDFVNQDFNSIIPALDASKFDAIMSAMTINSSRREKVAFVPYFQAGESLLTKKGSTLTFKALPDLCGQKVAVEQGTAEADEIKTLTCATAPTVQTYPTDSEAIQQLRKGTVDVEFTDSPVAAYDAKQDSSLVVASSVLEIAPEGIAVRRTSPDVCNAISRAFDALIADGSYDRILVKWNLKDGDIRLATPRPSASCTASATASPATSPVATGGASPASSPAASPAVSPSST